MTTKISRVMSQLATDLAASGGNDLVGTWSTRTARPGGGSGLFAVDAYESYYSGAGAQTEYHGRQINATNILLGPGGTDPLSNAPGSVAAFQYDTRYGGTLADPTGFLVPFSARCIANTGFTGGISNLATTIVRGKPGAASANFNMVGLTSQCVVETDLNGTNTGAGAQGAVFGGSWYLACEAAVVNLLDMSNEIDVVAKAGSSTRFFRTLALCNGAEIRGTELDCFLSLSGYPEQGLTPIGKDIGIAFTDANGAEPFYSGSWLMKAKWITNPSTPRAIAGGIDLSLFNIGGGTGTVIQGSKMILSEYSLDLGTVAGNSVITAGNGVSDANLVLRAKGGGGLLLRSGDAVDRVKVDSGVGVEIKPLASSTPSSNGFLSFEATSNTSLTFKYRGSDGTVRSASLVLA